MLRRFVSVDSGARRRTAEDLVIFVSELVRPVPKDLNKGPQAADLGSSSAEEEWGGRQAVSRLTLSSDSRRQSWRVEAETVPGS